MRAKESFAGLGSLARRVLGHNRTTTKHNMRNGASSLVKSFGLLLARGFAQMGFGVCPAIRTKLRRR